MCIRDRLGVELNGKSNKPQLIQLGDELVNSQHMDYKTQEPIKKEAKIDKIISFEDMESRKKTESSQDLLAQNKHLLPFVTEAARYSVSEIHEAEKNFYEMKLKTELGKLSVDVSTISSKPLLHGATEENMVEHCSDMISSEQETPKIFVDDLETLIRKESEQLAQTHEDKQTEIRLSKSWADVVASDTVKKLEEHEAVLNENEDAKLPEKPISKPVKICVSEVQDTSPEKASMITVDAEGFIEVLPKKEIRKRKSRSRSRSHTRTENNVSTSKSHSRSRSPTKVYSTSSEVPAYTKQESESSSELGSKINVVQSVSDEHSINLSLIHI